MKSDKEKIPDYGNWVPEKLLILLWSLSFISAIILILNLLIWNNLVVTIIFAVATALLIFYSVFMSVMHHKFSFTGGKLMKKIHDYLISKLPWNGQGKLLDIGCGSGALAINCAKKFPESQVTGIDYWGIIWNYAQEQCENNAKIENANNINFIKGDASKLCFDSESVDAAISNFVFHEVRTVLDKRKLVTEALRVVKKGGAFAFHDIFESKRMYGDINEFIDELKKSGIKEIHYEPHTENLPFVPSSIKLMFNNMGIIYGIK